MCIRDRFNEVAPPGFGHTKSDKEKGVKKGGTAAAFKRALDRGDFKGLPGSKTKKEKTADMFKLMWAMKKKGDKPNYKPGTDKKYEKYQEESVNEGEKKGLWDNIHAKRKRGEKPAKPGDKDYPKTLNVEGLEKARKNVGASKCWDGYKAKGTKKKGGKEVPNCVKEEDKAFDYVVSKLKKQHGDGVLTKRDKIKPQSPAEKAKGRAHQAKVDQENAAERAKDPSQGRYPKG